VHADVSWTIELRAHLADLGGHVFIVKDRAFRAERPTARRAGNRELPVARADHGNVIGVELAERRGLALLDQLDRGHDVFLIDALDGAGRVVRAKLLPRGPPVVLQRSVVELFLPGHLA
jgi:hypothetical protein